ncbi:hypothetical protein ABH989_006203 [Bradyrhizobium ottawaense]
MITEIAQIEIKLGTESHYEAAIAHAKTLPPPAGFHGFELYRGSAPALSVGYCYPQVHGFCSSLRHVTVPWTDAGSL